MLLYPNAKVNIGLFVTEKRSDGFHNLETVFYPVGLTDILEVNPIEGKVCRFINTGIDIDCREQDNLVMRAYHLLAADYTLPAVQVHLHKIIPFGAGLGGGSSDAAFMLKALNELFELHISGSVLEAYAARLGSDCAFFIRNRPVFAHGKGELLEEISLSLDDYRIVLVKPDCGVSTPEAYAGIKPDPASFNLRNLSILPVNKWKESVVNNFESTVFVHHPEIGTIKDKLYGMGAIWASMTGSGSAVVGIFRIGTDITGEFPGCFVWSEEK